jgi:hypothetical protein
MMVNGIEYDTCPNCHTEWSDCRSTDGSAWQVKCLHCLLRASPWMFSKSVGDKWVIFWSKGSCSIYKAANFGLDPYLYDPETIVVIQHWLPLNITPERLHLLLLFS